MKSLTIQSFGLFPSILAIALAASLLGAAPGFAQSTGLVEDVTSRILTGRTVDPTSFTLALDAMPEELLYELAEHYRLSDVPDFERKVYERLCARFPQSVYVPKARFEIALVDLMTMGNWPRSREMFRAVAREFPDSGFDEEALRFLSGITSSTSVADLEILEYVFHKSLVDYHGTSAVDFAALKLADMIARKEAIAAVLASDLLPVRKGHRLLEAGNAAFYVHRFAEAEAAYQAVVNNAHMADGDILAATYCQLGCLHGYQYKNYATGAGHYRTVLNGYPEYVGTDACLWQLGQLAELNDDMVTAVNCYRDILIRFPASRHAVTVRGKVGYIPELADAKPPASGATQATAVASAPKAPDASTVLAAAAEKTAIRELLAAAVPRKPCGPVAFRETCGLLGVAVSEKESLALCPTDARGRTSFRDLAEALGAKGLQVDAREIGVEQLRALGQSRTPVILHLDEPGDNHFVVLKSLDGETAVMVDNTGEYKIALAALIRWWDGYVLAVRRPAAAGRAV